MKIIQSFYQIENNSAYFTKEINDNYLVNFYSLLLSYIKLKEFYGETTFYCNSFAYDNMLKYIPYDNIIFDELDWINPDNYKNEWGLMKFHVFEQQKEPFIHVDGDVFLFNDLLSEFIDNDDYDGIVQSLEFSGSIYQPFYGNNINRLKGFDLISEIPDDLSILYSGAIAYNNGVVGFKNMEFLEKYISNAKKMNDLINEKIFNNVHHQTMLFEQFCLYHTSIKEDMNFHKIIPLDLIKEIGFNAAGTKLGYTHLLSGNKYVKHFVMLVRNKIMKDYPEYRKNIREFEKSISNANIEYLEHKNINELMDI